MDDGLNDMANEAQNNAPNLDLNEPANEEANMDIDDLQDQPVPQLDVPDQQLEPPLHINLSLSNVSSAVSFSLVAVNKDLNDPEEADPVKMIVMALPALQAQQDQLPYLNEGLEIEDPNQGDPIQLQDQIITVLNDAILDQGKADNVPVMPDLDLEQMMDEDETVNLAPNLLVVPHTLEPNEVFQQNLQLGFV